VGNLRVESASQAITAGWNRIVIPTTHLPMGTYLLAFQTENGAFNYAPEVSYVQATASGLSYGPFPAAGWTLSSGIAHPVLLELCP
jgi:hypothetical protein